MPKDLKKSQRADVNVNVHRIFEEAIRRSEEPPSRGRLKPVAPPPAKKSGATKKK